MKINGSPSALKLFEFDSPGSSTTLSQDLFTAPDSPNLQSSTIPNISTPPSNKRPCFRNPSETGLMDLGRKHNRSILSPLSATVANSIKGIYSSQEVKDVSGNLHGEVWKTIRKFHNNDVLQSYTVRNILKGKCLYRGKVAHLAVMIKSVENLSQKDKSLVLSDHTGEITGTVHHKVLEKWGMLLVAGSALLLRQATIFSFISVQKYINITLPNIVHIYNTSSLAPPDDVIHKHILEVSEVNVQREECPDSVNVTPPINTPNRPPPRISRPSSSRSTPNITPSPAKRNSVNKTSTPANKHSVSNTTPVRPKSASSIYSRRSAPSFSNTNHLAFNNNANVKPINNTNINLFDVSTTESINTSVSTTESINTSVSTTESVNTSVSTTESINTSVSTCSSTTPLKRPPSDNTAENKKLKSQNTGNQISLQEAKEQEEIAKLLEDIDDSFFDDVDF